MAMKIMPMHGLFACRRDADWYALCSMGRAYIPQPKARNMGAPVRQFYRFLRAHIFHAVRPHQDAEPPSI